MDAKATKKARTGTFLVTLPWLFSFSLLIKIDIIPMSRPFAVLFIKLGCCKALAIVSAILEKPNPMKVAAGSAFIVLFFHDTSYIFWNFSGCCENGLMTTNPAAT